MNYHHFDNVTELKEKTLHKSKLPSPTPKLDPYTQPFQH